MAIPDLPFFGWGFSQGDMPRSPKRPAFKSPCQITSSDLESPQSGQGLNLGHNKKTVDGKAPGALSTMNKIENTATLDDIREIVQQIVERFRPQKVILFGSYAQGKPTQDSDVDLLVVMETNEQALHAAARISAAIEHPFPLDILVFRPSELKASLERRGVFATEVMAKGIVLHEA
jgi:predicted nucleotidyltransferase